jgi:hypothetical protein
VQRKVIEIVGVGVALGRTGVSGLCPVGGVGGIVLSQWARTRTGAAARHGRGAWHRGNADRSTHGTVHEVTHHGARWK